MAASQSEVRVRCEQCFVVFVSLEEFAHHGCVQQQMVDQNSRMDGIHENHSWIPPQTHDQVDPSQLVTVVQPETYAGQHSPPPPPQPPQQQQQTQHQQQSQQQQHQLQAQSQQQNQSQQQQQHQQTTHAVNNNNNTNNNLHLDKPSQELESDSTAAAVDASLLSCSDTVDNEPSGASTPSSVSHWTRDATLLLIQLYRENEPNFNRSNRKKKFVWQDIADTLRQHGHTFTRQQVEGRWKTLTAAYRRTTQHNITSMDRRDWPFMEELRAVFDNGAAGTVACRGYSGAFMRCRRSGALNKRRVHLPKPRNSEQAEIIDWLSSYEQRHEQRYVGYMERLEKMHREKVNALRELVDVLKHLQR